MIVTVLGSTFLEIAATELSARGDSASGEDGLY